MTLLAFDWGFAIEKLVLIAIVITVSLVVAMYATYAERKVAGFMQDSRAFWLITTFGRRVKIVFQGGDYPQ